MPDCNYCDASFETEEEEISHLHDAHEGELSRIDRRRVNEQINPSTSGGWRPDNPTMLMIIGLLAAMMATSMFVSFLGTGSNNSDLPDGPIESVDQAPVDGDVHYHGTITVVVENQRIDFSQDRYQLRANAFHFENGNGEKWHVHANRVTLEYALATVGINVDETSDVVSVNDKTYRESDPGTSVTITVNGETVDPTSYVLQPDDSIRVVVTTDDSG